MVNKKERDLCIYRYRDAMETFEAASLCFRNNHFKDAINRSDYDAFYIASREEAQEQICAAHAEKTIIKGGKVNPCHHCTIICWQVYS